MHVTQLKTYFLHYGTHVISAIIIGLLGVIVIISLKKLLLRVLHKHLREETLSGFMVNITSAALFVILAIIVLDKLGVPTTSLVALLGAGGLAIGLAVRSSLANIAAGVMIIFLRPFRLGDTIECLGVSGTVTAINLFNTYIKTENHELIFLPNEKIINDKIINRSMSG